MNGTFWLPRPLAWGAAGLVLGALFGCSSGFSGANPKRLANASAPLAAAPARSLGSDNPGINLQCDADRFRKAPAPFHWSYDKIVPPLTNADWEADVTPDSITGTFIDSSGKRAIHGLRSDGTSWNTAVSLLTAPLPASTFALVTNSSATVRAGSENVNGESTIQYAIDTTRATGGEARLIKSVLGSNGFIKGAAWVTREGCPVKFVLDVAQHNADGTVRKEHYEANVTQR
ncbi:MAG TPA: hypothetical protein VKS44_12515 [Candidatus Acidoferrales bacterium]|nr:hypothetical protein [Candidatus Acidoferrales bacterium]